MSKSKNTTEPTTDETLADDWDESQEKSKSQLKQEMTALQELGESLISLTAKQLASIPLDEALKNAIEEAPGVTQRSAKKRHRQFIGKLMRHSDVDAIQEAYQRVKDESHLDRRRQQLMEKWRDSLIAGEGNDMSRFIEEYPQCDRQQFRQLIRAAQKEKQANKTSTQARKLFLFIRDTVSSS